MGWDGDEMEWDGSALCEGLPSIWALLHCTTNVTGAGCPSALRQVCAVLYFTNVAPSEQAGASMVDTELRAA